MISAPVGGGGVMEKWIQGRKLHEFSVINQIQMRTRGEGVRKSDNFADIVSGSSQIFSSYSAKYIFLEMNVLVSGRCQAVPRRRRRRRRRQGERDTRG